MSIAVMNWVWAHSPTSGNERLVLLALADACPRDDGTGCWPSAATIARKANISARTVRRVIARLEADGHLLVHRGGGRAGSTNSYSVFTGIRTPGQNVTPDTLSGGDNADRPPRTQPCHGGPQTQLCHLNHQGTTRKPPRRQGARKECALGGRPDHGQSSAFTPRHPDRRIFANRQVAREAHAIAPDLPLWTRGLPRAGSVLPGARRSYMHVLRQKSDSACSKPCLRVSGTCEGQGGAAAPGNPEPGSAWRGTRNGLSSWMSRACWAASSAERPPRAATNSPTGPAPLTLKAGASRLT